MYILWKMALIVSNFWHPRMWWKLFFQTSSTVKEEGEFLQELILPILQQVLWEPVLWRSSVLEVYAEGAQIVNWTSHLMYRCLHLVKLVIPPSFSPYYNLTVRISTLPSGNKAASRVNIDPRLTQSLRGVLLRDKGILSESAMSFVFLENCQQLYYNIIFRLVNPFLLRLWIILWRTIE